MRRDQLAPAARVYVRWEDGVAVEEAAPPSGPDGRCQDYRPSDRPLLKGSYWRCARKVAIGLYCHQHRENYRVEEAPRP